jgi:transcriptional regulator with XRE-family HTH domain
VVGRKIKALRVARGLTQDAVAEALGIAVKNVQRLEAGGQNLTLVTLKRVADVLGCEPFELLTEASAGVPLPTLAQASSVLEKQGHKVYEASASRPKGAIPLTSLRALATSFGDVEQVEVAAWIKLRGVPASRSSGRFVAQVVGRSMTPAIPHGALGLFRSPVVGPLEGRIVLAEWREASDPDSGGAYVLKRVGAIEAGARGNVQLQLVSDNPEFPPIVIDAENAPELRLVAELERVLWPTAAAKRSPKT